MMITDPPHEHTSTIYSGKLTDRKLIIGTWFNKFGNSGDFKLSIEN
jgi:hypothetical protein